MPSIGIKYCRRKWGEGLLLRVDGHRPAAYPITKNKHKDNHTKETNLLNALDGEQIGTGAKGADQGGQNASIDVVLLQARQNLIESAMVAKQVDEVNLRTRGNGRG